LPLEKGGFVGVIPRGKLLHCFDAAMACPEQMHRVRGSDIFQGEPFSKQKHFGFLLVVVTVFPQL